MTKFMSDIKIFEKGSEYNGFCVLNVFELKDYHSTAIYLRHKKTGLEVLHLVNDETENLFSFTFRTPNPEGNGAAHIMEHSVLCGSERYPLKDPFTQLSNQSVKTYLNAATYADKTVYPASSTVEADYFNLMSVYADAVFFPRLSPEIFAQEAHRLEIDGDGFTKEIPNLLVAGEAAGGIHGRNRLMGNSLLDVIVFGRNAGKKAAAKCKAVELGEMNLNHIYAYEEELKNAGVETGNVSPMLLPQYARHER